MAIIELSLVKKTLSSVFGDNLWIVNRNKSLVSQFLGLNTRIFGFLVACIGHKDKNQHRSKRLIKDR
jgi:hypothetical protein